MHIAIEKLFDPQLIVDKTFTPMKGNIALVKKLVEKKDSQGNRLHKVYLLSNLDNEVYELLLKKYPELFNLFDGRLISAEVGSLKHDPKIYQEMLTRYNLNPAECFFIDDQAENIVASKELGIAGAQYV